MAVRVRVLAPIAAILLACGAVAAPQPQDAEPSRDLQGFVNDMRSTQRLPGLAVVVVRSDGQPRVYVSGERRIGKGDPITPGDRMHLGSLTKAITATVIGSLAEQHRYAVWRAVSAFLVNTSEPLFVRIAVAGVAVGATILVLSVVREKFWLSRSDPYQKEINR